MLAAPQGVQTPKSQVTTTYTTLLHAKVKVCFHKERRTESQKILKSPDQKNS